VKVIEALFKLDALRHNGFGDKPVLGNEIIEDSITFYKISGFSYDENMNICKIGVKFAFNTMNQPEGILKISEYGSGSMDIDEAYKKLSEVANNGHKDAFIGEVNFGMESYNRIEDIIYEDKLGVCSFNLVAGSDTEYKSLLTV
jgi:hypothetical protein